MTSSSGPASTPLSGFRDVAPEKTRDPETGRPGVSVINFIKIFSPQKSWIKLWPFLLKAQSFNANYNHNIDF
jgi:hypothetical protein